MAAVGYFSAPRIMRRAGVLAGAWLVIAAATAAAATTASLKVSVSPTTVHRGGAYTLTITGRYRRHTQRSVYRIPGAHHSSPYLLAFIQYSGARCRKTATAEYALPTRYWSWVFYPPRSEPRSPFKLVFHERTRTRFGERRICAYLYPNKIAPRTTEKPIATASTAFRETTR
jgi:hypothetical protein